MTDLGKSILMWFFLLIFSLVCLVTLIFAPKIPAQAREFNVDGSKINWADIATDEQVREWYKNLKMPDNPGVSCCGEADAYWADSFETIDCTYAPNDEYPFPQKQTCYVAIITDDREDEPRGRKHIPIGTKFVVPNFKIKHDEGNPTGHAVVFIHAQSSGVLCYVPGGGV